MTEETVVIGLCINSGPIGIAKFRDFNMLMNIKENIAENEISSQYSDYELIESNTDFANNKFLYKYKVNGERKIR